MLTGISAITLATHDMARAVAFYEALGFVLKFGGPAASFTAFGSAMVISTSCQCPGNICGASGGVQSSMLTTWMHFMRCVHRAEARILSAERILGRAIFPHP
jgi:hypothetical protein